MSVEWCDKNVTKLLSKIVYSSEKVVIKHPTTNGDWARWFCSAIVLDLIWMLHPQSPLTIHGGLYTSCMPRVSLLKCTVIKSEDITSTKLLSISNGIAIAGERAGVISNRTCQPWHKSTPS